MKKVTIKRAKRNRKPITTSEKLLAGLGVGSSLIGGVGAINPQPATTQFVRTSSQEQNQASAQIKQTLSRIFGSTVGVESAKADNSASGAIDGVSAPAPFASSKQVSIDLTASNMNWGDGNAVSGWVVQNPSVGQATITVNYDASGTIVGYTIDGTAYTPQQLADTINSLGKQLYSSYYQQGTGSLADLFSTISTSDQRVYFVGMYALTLPGTPSVDLLQNDDRDPAAGTTGSGALMYTPPTTAVRVNFDSSGQPANQGVNDAGWTTDAQASLALSYIAQFHPNAALLDENSGTGGGVVTDTANAPLGSTDYGQDGRRDWIIVYKDANDYVMEVDVPAVLNQLNLNQDAGSKMKGPDLPAIAISGTPLGGMAAAVLGVSEYPPLAVQVSITGYVDYTTLASFGSQVLPVGTEIGSYTVVATPSGGGLQNSAGVIVASYLNVSADTSTSATTNPQDPGGDRKVNIPPVQTPPPASQATIPTNSQTPTPTATQAAPVTDSQTPPRTAAAPTIFSLTPGFVMRGSSVEISITGTDLGGATLSGLAQSGIIFTNVVVNSAGTLITATASASSTAASGPQVITATTQGGVTTASFAVLGSAGSGIQTPQPSNRVAAPLKLQSASMPANTTPVGDVIPANTVAANGQNPGVRNTGGDLSTSGTDASGGSDAGLAEQNPIGSDQQTIEQLENNSADLHAGVPNVTTPLASIRGADAEPPASIATNENQFRANTNDLTPALLQMPSNEVQAVTSTQGPSSTSTYTVKKGDTLWGIAQKYYGDGRKWRQIFEANTNLVKSPRTLRVGVELVIPDVNN